MRRIFELNDQSRKRCVIVLIFQIILTIVCQILGWVVQKNCDVYTYKNCTYKLSGATECSGYSSDQGETYSDYGCPGPTTKDCSIGQVIRNLYLAGLIMPLIWYAISAILALFIVLCFKNKNFKLKILLIGLIFCDLISAIFYFTDVSMINNNQNYQILFSQQTLGVCIVLGILYIFQMICKIYLNIMVFQYLTQSQTEEINVQPQVPQINQQHQHLYTNPHTIRDVNNQQNHQHQQQQQPKQPQEDAVLNQVIEISKYEQMKREHQKELERQQEEKLLREQQEQIKKQNQLELEEIKLVERLNQQEEEEQIKKAIQLSIQQQDKQVNNKYLPD